MRKILLSIFKIGIKLLSGHGLGEIYPVGVTYHFLIRHLKSNVAEVNGHKMFLDSKDSLGLSVFGVHEPFATELIKKEVMKGDVVLDIGAHIGYYTLIFAKLVGEEGKVFAFEPAPDNSALLEKNIKINGYRNVLVVEKAVSNKTGKLKLYLSEEDSADYRIYNSHDDRRSIEIEAIRLDDYFWDYDGKIDFIKIDINGAEGEALQGMSNLLKKNKNAKILTAFWPIGLKSFGIEPEEYLKLLIEYGFKLHLINENKIEPIAINELMQLCTQEDFKNLLCLS